ncbi:putative inner membrane protein [Klebsiella pneumoniae]|uniref:Putative inner membrane protein n=1 Tax=Klebsiella pneumoniae TaxID=573 RepID=A0A2X3CAC9_KLEPN|nr:putative inner membrane protein [Klebsiella pneumoniae]
MVVFFAMIGWGLLTAADHPALGLAMLFGIGFGLLIERAQICFTPPPFAICGSPAGR